MFNLGNWGGDIGGEDDMAWLGSGVVRGVDSSKYLLELVLNTWNNPDLLLGLLLVPG